MFMDSSAIFILQPSVVVISKWDSRIRNIKFILRGCQDGLLIDTELYTVELELGKNLNVPPRLSFDFCIVFLWLCNLGWIRRKEI